MKKFAAACALACALITVVAGTAAAHTSARSAAAGPITFGVADDTGKYADDGGVWFNGALKGASLTEERWTLQYKGDSTSIAELPFLVRAAPQAQKDNIKVELALYGGTDDGNTRPDDFCAWAAYVASVVQKWGIQDFIIWNEPNTGLYWKGAGTDDSVPAKYEALLASCYDKIKVINPSANVIGFGLSPRKGTPSQIAPIPFIKGVAAAYKASGRDKPIMDMMSVHPYPNPNSPADGPDVGYVDENNYGIPNLDRVKQAVYDGFTFPGSKQPTTMNGLMLVLDEVGWQTDTRKYGQYIHDENVKTIDEATQTQYLQVATAKYFACDPTISTVNWFLLVDEATRDGKDASGTAVGGGWQSGLMTAGGQNSSTAKAAYAALASAWAAGRAACTGQQVNWRPAGSTGGGSGNGGDSGSGSGAGSGTGTTTSVESDLAPLNGLLTDDELSDLSWALWVTHVDASTNQLGAFDSRLYGGIVQPLLKKIQTALGPVQGDATVIALYVWAAQGGRHLSYLVSPSARRLSASSVVVLGKTTVKVKAGKRINVKFKTGKQRVGKGYLYLVLGVRSAADPSKVGYVQAQVAAIQGPTSAAAAGCKHGQKSTKQKPCRKK